MRPSQAADPASAALPVFETLTAAHTWEQGLITGSGRVGAVIFGAPESLTICFSHERFFLPANPRPRSPAIAPALNEIREALASGDAAHAAALVATAAERSGYEGDLVWTDPLGICATFNPPRSCARCTSAW